MQLSNATSHSRAMDVTAAQGQLSNQVRKPDRLETLLEVRNDAWNTAPSETDRRSSRSAVPPYARMPAMASRIPSVLCGIAMLTLERATADEGAETGLISVSSGSEMIARSYGAAQIMRDNPVMGAIALTTTIAMACGAAYGLLSTSTTTDSPSAEPQQSVGATVMAACRNIISEIQQLGKVRLRSPLIPKLEAMDRGVDDLVSMVKSEIRKGTHAASLGSLKMCIDADLKSAKLRPLRESIEFKRWWLQRGAGSMRHRKREEIIKKFDKAAALTSQIDSKLVDCVDRLTDTIYNQNARNIPKIG